MHSPDEFWVGLVFRLANFIYEAYTGRRKVKRLEAELQESKASAAACERTMAWVILVASISVFGLCLFASLTLTRAYNRA